MRTAGWRASGDGAPCAIERGKQLVTTRADGAYAALFFRIVCKGSARNVTLDYRLLFDVDPDASRHRRRPQRQRDGDVAPVAGQCAHRPVATLIASALLRARVA